MFSRRYIWGVTAAFASVVVITALRLLIEAVHPTGHAPFVMLALPVVIAGIAGGFLPAMIAMALAILTIAFLFLEPLYSFSFTDETYVFQFILFSTEGLVIAILSEMYHRHLRIARAAREELELRVEQRTAQLADSNRKLMDEVHERARAEQSLFNERNSLSALLESLQDGIIACDVSGKIVRYNEATAEMFQIAQHSESPDESWRNMLLADPQSGRRLEGNDWPLARVLREGSYDEEELAIVTPDGNERLVSVSGRAIRNGEGRITGGVISLHDITEIVEARQRLTEVVEELQRSNGELQDFASVASHDLQEPLRKIQAFGDRLKTTQGERLDPQGRDYLSRMHGAASRMQTLINDLLAFSRITTRAQPFARINLAQIVTEVIDDLDARITSTNASIEVGDLPDLDADPLQMRQLVQNLLSNALKFRKPDLPPAVRIYADTRVDEYGEEWIDLRVQDNGIGFDVRYLDRIFNIFQRLHGRMEYDGTGVGLAVCRKIVQRHGGELTAQSRPGEGATFIATLPRYQTEIESTHAGA